MTIDDDNSIYVGGIPYDCTEENIRRVFDLYGSVIAVKIINARDVGGKCYCFVTFTNPRSAIDAINDMNGRTIGGRVVKVNEVNARGAGRPPPPPFHRSSERDMDWNNRGGRGDRERGGYDHERGDRYRNNADRSQDRDMPPREAGYDRPRGDYDRNRDHYLDRDQIRGPEQHYEQERNRSHDRDRGKEHNLDEYDHPHDYDRNRERSLDRDQVRGRDYHERERSRSRSQDRARSKENNLDLKRDTEVDRRIENDRKDVDKEHLSRTQSGSHFNDRRSRELSSSSNDNYNDEVKGRLDVSTQKHGDLEKKISQIKERLEEKDHIVSELKKKSQKLEDSVASAKRLTSQRQLQLSMLQRCFLQVKDYKEKLKNSEHELQALVDTVMADVDYGGEDD
ncbi:hypothetical protein MKW94_010070 [Papaver nudicaule]|uniref:RRM domain-containing protein n=1 Tax=Papaver nudicaule TaxID=74823 RepID=A0AA41SKW4_PAPNU|nr:hypothetical protein [Papaver nudicaule]